MDIICLLHLLYIIYTLLYSLELSFVREDRTTTAGFAYLFGGFNLHKKILIVGSIVPSCK